MDPDAVLVGTAATSANEVASAEPPSPPAAHRDGSFSSIEEQPPRPSSASSSSSSQRLRQRKMKNMKQFAEMPHDLQRPIRSNGSLVLLYLFVSHLAAVIAIPFALPGKPVETLDIQDGFLKPGIGLAFGFGLGVAWLFMLIFVHSHLIVTLELVITLLTSLLLEYMFYAGYFGLNLTPVGLLFLFLFVVRGLYQNAVADSLRVAFTLLDLGRRSVLPLSFFIIFLLFLDCGVMFGFVAIYVMWTNSIILWVTGIWILLVMRYIIYCVTASYAYLWYTSRGRLPSTLKPQLELFRRALGPGFMNILLASIVMDVAMFTKYLLHLLAFFFRVFNRWALQLDRYTNRAGLCLVLLKGKPLVQCCQAAHDVLAKAGTLDMVMSVFVYRSVFIISALVAILAMVVADTSSVAFLLAFAMMFTALSVFDGVSCAMWLAYSQDSRFASDVGDPAAYKRVEAWLDKERRKRRKEKERRIRRYISHSVDPAAELPDSHSDNDFDNDITLDQRFRDVPLDYLLDVEYDREKKM
eukprot:ANDGO_08601.mRNA.1 hypothetical protein